MTNKKIRIVFSNFIQIFYIPFSCILFLANEVLINIFKMAIIPGHELLVLIFSSILLKNVSSLIVFLDKTNFNFFSKKYNHWVYALSIILNRVLLIYLLTFFGFLLTKMILMEFKFGTIFVAESNWEYSWVFKIPLLFWVLLIGFYSIISLKSLILPFSFKTNK